MITVSAPRPTLPAPVRGALWMTAAGISLTAMSAVVRILADGGMHTFEIVFYRATMGIVAMTPWLIRNGFGGMRRSNAPAYFGRAFCALLSSICFFSAVAMLPLADVTALLFTRPLWAALLSMLFLHEIVARRRWTAMAAGFAGVLIMIRPGFVDLNLGVWLAIASAGLAAGSAIFIKFLAQTESPDAITVYYAVWLAPMAAVLAAFVIHVPSWTELGWCLALGFLGATGQRAMSRSFAAADVSYVLPFDFTRLIFAAALGYALFGQMPVIWTGIGGTVIFAATILLARRETRVAAKAGGSGGRV
jgi:drug/metabolite transporter (DMT)-like permease